MLVNARERMLRAYQPGAARSSVIGLTGALHAFQAAAEGILVIKHDVMTMEINENPPLVNDFPIQGIDFQAAACIWTAQNDMS